MNYGWKDGARFSVDAQKVGARLEKIEKRHGAITRELVVDDAASESSPLHPAFEWDDATAAHQYRINQAGHLLRKLTVVVEDVRDEPMRAYMIVVSDEGTAYANARTVMSDEDLRAWT